MTARTGDIVEIALCGEDRVRYYLEMDVSQMYNTLTKLRASA